MNNNTVQYRGYEMGPIRPPSESGSLLLRITRNCPWNQCRFCSLYKDESFSVRSKEHIMQDIRLAREIVDILQNKNENPNTKKKKIMEILSSQQATRELVYYNVLNWYRNGMKSVFLQDANSLVMKPEDTIAILENLRQQFPEIQRITCYARSHTIARISDKNLHRMAVGGLNRIHIGMETASEEVLKLIKKGADKATHILAGQKVKRTSMQLSEYYMPGLGGKEYAEDSALETADALNQINPDYIRIRTLALHDHSRLKEDYDSGVFTRSNDIQMVKELMLMIQNLEGITSILQSDHIINLLPEVEGKLPEDKEKMLAVIKRFLSLSDTEQMLYRIGRRTGVMNVTNDLVDPGRRKRVQQVIDQNGITAHNVDLVTDELIQRYI